ncbi:MAG: tripartite tricarboxylate transporter substrate binding protein [Burkholderiales bacterium]|nr:tripartite tricarboxylate transporter substrate binding protein [Burkholderiales bacterium]
MGKSWRVLAAAILVATGAGAAAQEAFPARPVRLVVGFGAGGITDVLARVLAAELPKVWGQPVVVENRPGASGVIGAELVARAAPDGHVLLMAPGTHTIVPGLRKQMPYDAVRDFTAITLLASAPNMLVVHAETPYRSLGDYLAAAKARPGEVAYATSGIGTTVHIAGERLAHLAGVRFNHIPYKSSSQSIEAVVAGQVVSSWSAVNSALPHIRSGRVRPLAVAAEKRSSFAPDVPTFDELGVKGMKSDTWLGVLGPAGMPPALAARINADLVRLLARPDIRERVLGLGAEPVAGIELEKYAALLREEVDGFAAIIRAANIKAE